jgi:hypothetical protein
MGDDLGPPDGGRQVVPEEEGICSLSP